MRKSKRKAKGKANANALGYICFEWDTILHMAAVRKKIARLDIDWIDRDCDAAKMQFAMSITICTPQ